MSIPYGNFFSVTGWTRSRSSWSQGVSSQNQRDWQCTGGCPGLHIQVVHFPFFVSSSGIMTPVKDLEVSLILRICHS
jgi:hypothetical protein